MSSHQKTNPESNPESTKVFKALFGAEPPTHFHDRYAKACSAVFGGISAAEIESNSRLLTYIGDLEALELASRIFKINPLLTTKFRIAVALGECEPNLRPKFVNELPQKWALVILGSAVLRTALKFVKGLLLLTLCRFGAR